MAYADQRGLSGSKLASIIIVILVHAVLGYAFVTGLAFNVVKKVAQDLKTFDVEEEPPPIVSTNVAPAPTIVTVPNPPPVFVPTPAPPAPPPPPPPPVPTVSKAAGPKGDPSRFVTTDDYPPRALREGAEGTTRITWDINTEGRVENCRVASSSGNSDLDDAACRAMTRKGRFSPALDQNGNPIKSSQSRNVRWQIPK